MLVAGGRTPCNRGIYPRLWWPASPMRFKPLDRSPLDPGVRLLYPVRASGRWLCPVTCSHATASDAEPSYAWSWCSPGWVWWLAKQLHVRASSQTSQCREHSYRQTQRRTQNTDTGASRRAEDGCHLATPSTCSVYMRVRGWLALMKSVL
jgi:hypothetical protein